MNLLEEHDVNREEKFVKKFVFGFLTCTVMVEKGTAVPGGYANRFVRKRVGRRW